MNEPQRFGMEKRAFEIEAFRSGPVPVVSDDWVFDCLQMNSDLVSSTGLETASHECEFWLNETLENLISGTSVSAVQDDCLFRRLPG